MRPSCPKAIRPKRTAATLKPNTCDFIFFKCAIDGADAISLSNSLDVGKVNPAVITTIFPPDFNPAGAAEFFNPAGLFSDSVYGRPLECVCLSLRDE